MDRWKFLILGRFLSTREKFCKFFKFNVNICNAFDWYDTGRFSITKPQAVATSTDSNDKNLLERLDVFCVFFSTYKLLIFSAVLSTKNNRKTFSVAAIKFWEKFGSLSIASVITLLADSKFCIRSFILISSSYQIGK